MRSGRTFSDKERYPFFDRAITYSIDRRTLVNPKSSRLRISYQTHPLSPRQRVGFFYTSWPASLVDVANAAPFLASDKARFIRTTRLSLDIVSPLTEYRDYDEFRFCTLSGMNDSVNRRDETIVGLVADTHGLLRPEALAALSGVDLIIHAGDIGRKSILETLAQLAPVYAVSGNVDQGTWADALPISRRVDIGQVGVYIYHGHATPDIDVVKAGCQVIVSGHSHKAKAETRDAILYLNPGSAGPRRFKLPVTLSSSM